MDLLKIAKEILAVNPQAALSGSLALNFQDKKTRREPKDIDIYMPFGIALVQPEGMIECTYGAEGEIDSYEDELYERKTYKYARCNVDILYPIDGDVPPLQTVRFNRLIHSNSDDTEDGPAITSDGIRCVEALEIMKMKVSHGWGDSFSRYKHRQDLIFMMLE